MTEESRNAPDKEHSSNACGVPDIGPEYDVSYHRISDGHLNRLPPPAQEAAQEVAQGAEPGIVITDEHWQADLHPAHDGSGVVSIHVVDVDERRRVSLHGAMSKRTNAVVRAYRSGADFLNDSAGAEAGCVLLCCDQFDGAHLTILNQITQDARYSVVVLADDADVRSGVRAMKRGATDFLAWPYSAAELGDAVNLAIGRVRQRMAVSSAAARAQERIARLSAREREVLRGLLDGQSNKMIALKLSISPRTVEIYRAHLMEKLGVRSLSDVLKVALSAGMDVLGDAKD